MRPLSGYSYIRATSLEEARAVMGRDPEGNRFLAGGTDLLVKLKKGQIRASRLISLKGIPDLFGLTESEGRIKIGSLVTVNELVDSKLLQEKAALLSMAASELGSRQIRNLATLGGNVCNASPAADLSVALVCLEAQAEIRGVEGTRIESVEGLFRGPGLISLKREDIVSAFWIPVPSGQWCWNYQKLSTRRAMEIGVVNVAIGLRRDRAVCKEVRIGLGAVAPTPMRVRTAEACLGGKQWDPELIERVALMCGQEARCIDDIRASAAYRREMVTHLVRRGLATAWASGDGNKKGK
ncbi:MAG: hypothetical protein A2170_09320 [Deltaproteobacteria bacterium RBG_13_53_10]|nr:MAG: hypothetical protein A2170_09320 [Deltaproteobacteria bacterium RBG_13_53_10]